mgnify:CR=1 FL=1
MVHKYAPDNNYNNKVMYCLQMDGHIYTLNHDIKRIEQKQDEEDEEAKQKRLEMQQKQEEEWNKGNDIPSEIPPKCPNLPSKMTFKNRASYIATFYIVNN